MADRSGRWPNLFIVGAPKSGTTALYEQLALHPEIFMSPIKEPLFFADDLFSPWHIRDDKQYLSLFSEADDSHRYRGEGSTRYLASTVAADNIASRQPDARIIILLRDPVDAMYAMYTQLLYGGRETAITFEEALELEQDRREGRLVPTNTYPVEVLFYRWTYDYPRQIERYLSRFPRDQIDLIIYDEYINNNRGVYRRICESLNIDPNFEPTFDTVNQNKISRNGLILRLLRPRSRGLRRFGRIVLPRSVSRRIWRWNTTFEPRESLSGALRDRLTAEMRPTVERLEELIGRDLSAWYRSPSSDETRSVE